MTTKRFSTGFRYSDRESKARYVFMKYGEILRGRILDVGADECHLKKNLPQDADYWGIGLGGHPDQVVNLEKEAIPAAVDSFDCVVCLDVLEHVDNLHSLFDNLCRVSRRYVIISLPNAWWEFYRVLRVGGFALGQPLKFYGLPLEPPEDRHKWFFSSEEAERFVAYRAGKNGMRVVEMDYYGMDSDGSGLLGALRALARYVLFRRDLNTQALYAGTLWAVMEKVVAQPEAASPASVRSAAADNYRR